MEQSDRDLNKMGNGHADDAGRPAPLRWLAYELHDGLLPWLQSAYMLLSDISLSEGTTARYETGLRLIQHAMDEGRQLMNFLESAGDEKQLNLAAAVSALLARVRPLIEESGQRLVISGSLEAIGLSCPATVWNIVRSLQQALMNAIQHAGPATIQVRVKAEEGEMILQVWDDGRGFQPSTIDTQNHFGITSMRQRVKSMGGQFQLDSQPNEGTRLCLRIPLEGRCG
jgi:signal transduction histidine kinase